MFRIKRVLAALLAVLLLFSVSFAEESQSIWTDLGTGSGQMTVIVVLPDLTTKGYRIHSDSETLLEGLLAWSARDRITFLFCKPDTSGRLIYDVLRREAREWLSNAE